VSLDAANELWVDAPRPALEELTVPRALDVENEVVSPAMTPRARSLRTGLLRTRLGSLARLASIGLSAQHGDGLSSGSASSCARDPSSPLGGNVVGPPVNVISPARHKITRLARVRVPDVSGASPPARAG
jgi:hypothetical protein